MSIQQIIWLLFVSFLVVVFVLLLSTWRGHKELRAKILRGKPRTANETFNAELERQKAYTIFKGRDKELQEALKAIALLEKSDQMLAEAGEQDKNGQRSLFQLIVFMAFMIALGIIYGLYRFTNAP